MNKYISLLILSCFIIISCSKSEEEKIAEVERLYQKVREIPASEPCKNLTGYARIKKLESKYSTNLYSEITKSKIEKYTVECDTYKKELEAERKRLEELNKLGTWSLGRYVDEFGDPTGKTYIQNTSFGSFSNTATDNSILKVEMMLSSDKMDKPWFRIYEYESMLLKGYYDYNQFICKVKSSSGNEFGLFLGINDGSDFFRIEKPGRWDDKIYKDGPKKLNELIVNQQSAKFSCYDSETPSSKYRFDLYFNYYENALRKFNEL